MAKKATDEAPSQAMVIRRCVAIVDVMHRGRVSCGEWAVPLEITTGSNKVKPTVLPLCWHHQELATEFLAKDQLKRLIESAGPKEAKGWKILSRESVVYFVRRGGDGAVKIGYTVNLKSRMSGIATGSGPLEVLATLPGGEVIESLFHKHFAEYRLHGEWFAPHESVLTFAAENDGVERSHLEWIRELNGPAEDEYVPFDRPALFPSFSDPCATVHSARTNTESEGAQ